MKEILHIESWSMPDFSVQASIAPELFGEECDVIQVKREEKPVLAVLPWDQFMEILRAITLEKMEKS